MRLLSLSSLLLLVVAAARAGDAPPATAGAPVAGQVADLPDASVASPGPPVDEPAPMGEDEVAVGITPRTLVRTVPERWTIPPEVITAVRAVRDTPVGVRMEVASRFFLDLPYTNEAAGEGDGQDPDPLSRYDTFDCLTFVEEVTALALAADPLYAPAIRDAFRYRGPPTYANRRHFMEAQWVPDAIRNGLVEDITARVGRATHLEKTVTVDTWKRWRHRAFFALPDADLPVGTWALDYLDLESAAEAVPWIPPGAILLTVRVPRNHNPTVTTHISMVVPTTDGVRMRHATRMGARKVRDDRLDWYVGHLEDYVNWPALGIVVLRPVEQGPRIAAVPSVLPPPPQRPALTLPPRPVVPAQGPPAVSGARAPSSETLPG